MCGTRDWDADNCDRIEVLWRGSSELLFLFLHFCLQFGGVSAGFPLGISKGCESSLGRAPLSPSLPLLNVRLGCFTSGAIPVWNGSTVSSCARGLFLSSEMASLPAVVWVGGVCSSVAFLFYSILFYSIDASLI